MYNSTAASYAATSPKNMHCDQSKTEYFKSIADHCGRYKTAHHTKSIGQLVLTLALFLATCTLSLVCIANSLWIGYALLTLPASGLLVKLFIIQHDCGHGSFFNSKKANDFLGRCISILTWTPYYYWKRMHNIHHAGSGNLERRGYGGIETLTIDEYTALPKSQRIKYRLYRNLFAMLILGTPVFIILGQRSSQLLQPFIHPEGAKKVEFSGANIPKSIWGTNLALLLAYGTAGYFIGYMTLLTLYLPILVMTCWIGGWLFYIQHQFEETHWDRQTEWSYNEAAIMGSSYYDLPKWAQWFSGNIGIHHVHHLNASIPNYRLQECLDDMPELKDINRMTFRDSLKCAKWALWDETNRKMVTFKALKS